MIRPISNRAALLALLSACSSCRIPADITPAPATAPAEIVALTGASVFIGAGDVAVCGANGDELTARLVDSVLKADTLAKVEDAVFLLGDNAYPDGSASNFALCFAPSWGDSTKLILKKIRPAPGNHEHLSQRAAPYYEYFGSRAGSSKKGYYSYDLGEWHMLVINSEIIVNNVFTEEERKDQLDWIAGELKGPQKQCTLAYFHHPRYSSGWHGDNLLIQPIWQMLYDGGVDVILTGHDHEYERFQPMNAVGQLDTLKGMASYVVGTGGGVLGGFRRNPSAHSGARVQGYFGVLKMTLGKGGYASAFLDVSGRVWDPIAGKCNGTGPANEPATPTATTPAATSSSGSPVPLAGAAPVVSQQAGDAMVLGTIGAVDANIIEAAKLASTKASSAEVRTFATMLLAEHQKSLTTGADLAKEFKIERLLPNDSLMARTQERKMTELATLSGSVFDKSFMQFMADIHASLITKFSATLLPQATRLKVQTFVKDALPSFTAHKETAAKWVAAHPT